MYDDGPARMIRHGPWKFIYQQLADREHMLLFHLQHDPHEQDNVVDQHPDILTQLLPLIHQDWHLEAINQRHQRSWTAHGSMAQWSHSRPEGEMIWTQYRGKLQDPTRR